MVIASGAAVAQARRLAGLSTRQVAALAAVSPSTVVRIEREEVDPGVKTFEAILAACGYEWKGALARRTDVDAVRAARLLLNPGCEVRPNSQSALLESRWASAGLQDDIEPTARAKGTEWAKRIVSVAALQAGLAGRPGATRFLGGDWTLTARSLEDAGEEWALTGGYAAGAFTLVSSANLAVFYVEDVTRAAAAAGLGQATNRANTLLIPFDDVSRAGVWTTEGGVRLADFWQIVIDCAAGDDRMPAQAEAMIQKAFA